MSDAVDWVALVLHLVERVDVDDAESLRTLIGTADMVNHAILDVDELNAALDDLSSRGWLDVRGSVCALTPEANALAADAVVEARSPMAVAELATKLEAFPRFTAPAVPHADAGTFRRGLDSYMRTMDSILAKMRN